MGRRKDSHVWDHFEQTDKASKCKYCGTEFNGKPSVTRLKKHLLREKNGGICICTNVPAHVKQTLADGSNKRPRVEASSSNDLICNSISTSALPQQNYGFENQVHNGERMEVGVQQDTAQDISEGLDMDNTGHGIAETKADALLTTELVGIKFQEKREEICSSIMKDEVLSIGIYGMGGVGKTELAKHVHNKLLESQKFHQVYWVTVSPDCSILSLQDAIAKAAKLDLSNEDDENKRAVILSKKLMAKKKCVLFLDDVWSDIPLDRVGVPDILNRCKMILTTRSLDVCQRMDCTETIKVKCLCSSGEIEDADEETEDTDEEIEDTDEETEDTDEDEDWALFLKIMGGKTKLPSELKQIAKSIVKECEGLPLMIISMARRMKGVHDMHDWRNTLEDLKKSRWMEDHEEVFQKLKQSYIHLKNPALQQCLLYCALFCKTDKEVLINHLIVEGIVGGMSSRQAAVDKGHALLNALQNACLLEYEYGDLHMHGLIRHVAIKVMKEITPSMVEVGRQLMSLPLEKFWTEDIVRVSLMNNNIREIPSHHSPRCPNLSTLLLCNNTNMKSIGEPFFNQLHGLKVLNLSKTGIEKLPKFVADLENLTALILRDCVSLTNLPSLRKLKTLEMLDLCGCIEFEKLPEGLESLFNLDNLNFLYTEVKELPAGILTNLSHLQFLGFYQSSEEVKVKGEELRCLCNLETLFWRFLDVEDFNNYMQTKKQQLSNYMLLVCPIDDIRCYFLSCVFTKYWSSQHLFFSNCEMNGKVLLPKYVQKLDIFSVTIHNRRSLCLRNAIDLKDFEISCCEEIEYLFCLSSSTSIFRTLEALEVSSMNNLRGLFSRGGVDGLQPPTPQLPPRATFRHLKKFTIKECHSMKKLFPCALFSNLQNLQQLNVYCCSEMEEIIASEEEEGCSSHSIASEEEEEEEEGCSAHSIFIHTRFTLPNLKRLQLGRLPKLKSICNANLKCDSLQYVKIYECPELRSGAIPTINFTFNHSLTSEIGRVEQRRQAI